MPYLGGQLCARGVHDWIPPITLAFWRWAVAFAFLLPISYPTIHKEWPIIIKHWKYLVTMSAFGVTTFNTLVYFAAHHTSAQHIALISATAPVGTLLLAGLFKIERLSRYKLGGAICAFSGALVVISNGSLSSLFSQSLNFGDKLLLVSALIWASWGVALIFKPKALSTRSFLITLSGIGTLFLTPLYIWETIYVALTPFSFDAWAAYIYLGIGSSVFAWGLWQYSVETIGAIKTSLLYYSLPLFNAVLAITFLG
jgi:drug/metabolite transporter (DMT)-like permease